MKTAAHHSSGMHLIADLHGVDTDKLCDAAGIEAVLRQAALAAGATILYCHFHVFGPGQGITGVLLLAESHISIHTWPEHGFAAVDIFMCGDAEPRRAMDIVVTALEPESTESRGIARGARLPA